MNSGQQTPVTQQTNQTKDPWAPSQQYLQQAMGQAGNLFNADVGYLPYGGGTQAPLNANMSLGLSQMANTLAPDVFAGGTAGVKAGQALGLEQMQDRGLSPELQSLYQQAQGDQNPYLQNILDTNNRRIGDRVNSSVSGAGRYGSGAHTDIMTRALAESADPVLAQDYARRQQQMQGIAEGGLQRAGQWAQLMPTLDQARLQPMQDLMGVGQYEQERSQAQLNDDIKYFNTMQSRPWEQVARLNAIAGQAGALGGSQFGQQTTPINQPSTLQKLFGGAAAGAGIGGSFGGPVGGAAGAGIGGLLGLL